MTVGAVRRVLGRVEFFAAEGEKGWLAVTISGSRRH